MDCGVAKEKFELVLRSVYPEIMIEECKFSEKVVYTLRENNRLFVGIDAIYNGDETVVMFKGRGFSEVAKTLVDRTDFAWEGGEVNF